MPIFKEKDIKEIEEKVFLLKSRRADLTRDLWSIAATLSKDRAQEYLVHGVMRRLGVIEHCVERIYSIFPPRRDKLLSSGETKDIEVSLHAFFVNIFGLLDNMAWVILYEFGNPGQLDQRNVGLYKSEIQDLMSLDFKSHLNLDKMKNWHDVYLQDYRDSLAHRIPPYLPPKGLNPSQISELKRIEEEHRKALMRMDFNACERLEEEENQSGDLCPFFKHSLHPTINEYKVKKSGLDWTKVASKLVDNNWARYEHPKEVSLRVDLGDEREKIRSVFGPDSAKVLSLLDQAIGSISLHAQVITDFGTVEQIIQNFCGIFSKSDSATQPRIEIQGI